MRLAREMLRFDQFLQSEEVDVNVPKSAVTRDKLFFEKEEEVVLQGYENIKKHYREHLEGENQFILDNVASQLKVNDIALVGWKYLEYYLCPYAWSLAMLFVLFVVLLILALIITVTFICSYVNKMD
ncbi:methyl-accepting chemotaxis protein [Weissella oryzae SG25]|uniref:Methyl-accepting chemotaxis protein n=1 Tax=Weissella oryzae (strain DSM 25784 / JCM 18191 / LMG 30913 / SG25) TaxID=1329250 RepID=A0A069CTL9_WEIOS|nr:hypothetical protein [Weissella oryzae]GAK31160.1 methyl-accepting chemotaxis protein [Weissella oryzae SG25]